MNTNKIKETIQLTLEGKITFPQVVGALIKEGIESYHIDYVRSENTYYLNSRLLLKNFLRIKSKLLSKEYKQEKLIIILFQKK